MPPVIRQNVDLTTGHGCYPPTDHPSCSTNVEVNNIPLCRLTDPITPHCCPPCHGGSISSGSPDTECNNLKVARNGDSVSCGDTCSNGSGNVICN